MGSGQPMSCIIHLSNPLKLARYAKLLTRMSFSKAAIPIKPKAQRTISVFSMGRAQTKYAPLYTRKDVYITDSEHYYPAKFEKHQQDITYNSTFSHMNHIFKYYTFLSSTPSKNSTPPPPAHPRPYSSSA
jgi:hypothetical protein